MALIAVEVLARNVVIFVKGTAIAYHKNPDSLAVCNSSPFYKHHEVRSRMQTL